MNGQRIIGIVYKQSRARCRSAFYVLFREIINLNLVVVPAFGIVTGKFSGFLEHAIRQFFIVGFYDDVGTRHSFCMEPPVISGCELEREFIVLEVIFANINIIAVGGDGSGTACSYFWPFVGALPADIAVFDQLFLDLYEIVFRECNIERGCDALQVFDLGAVSAVRSVRASYVRFNLLYLSKYFWAFALASSIGSSGMVIISLV